MSFEDLFTAIDEIEEMLQVPQYKAYWSDTIAPGLISFPPRVRVREGSLTLATTVAASEDDAYAGPGDRK